MRDYRKIRAWVAADALIDLVYDIVAELPRDERYVLSRQMRRAALSIVSNIAEGAGRGSDADFERFLWIAAGSSSELQSQLEFAKRRWPRIENIDQALDLAHVTKRMLRGLIRASRRNRRSERGNLSAIRDRPSEIAPSPDA